MDARHTLGQLGEQLASDYLAQKGYLILARNYRKPWGEIDIIARKDNIVSIIEVKANKSSYAVNSFRPELRVDKEKMKKLIRTAILYIQHELKQSDIAWQIDIVAITFDNQNKKAHLTHFKNI